MCIIYMKLFPLPYIFTFMIFRFIFLLSHLFSEIHQPYYTFSSYNRTDLFFSIDTLFFYHSPGDLIR